MRCLSAVLVLVTACGAHGAGATTRDDGNAEFRGGGPRAAKIHSKLITDWREGIPRGFELVLVVDVDPAAADPERVRAIGAHEVRPVAVEERGPYGVRTTKADPAAPATTWLVHAPVEILRYLAELPWVTGVALANSWPGGPELPDEVDRRLDPFLRGALGTFGAERPFAVSGLGKGQGCFDDARRRELSGLGAIVNTVIEGKDCESSIFTFEVPIGSLVALAGLPWVVQLEGSRPMYIEQE